MANGHRATVYVAYSMPNMMHMLCVILFSLRSILRMVFIRQLSPSYWSTWSILLNKIADYILKTSYEYDIQVARPLQSQMTDFWKLVQGSSRTET